MEKLAEVEEAKALMTEAMNWSVVRWLREKKRVRKTADKANEALWAMQKQIKSGWSKALQAAYADLDRKGNSGRAHEPDPPGDAQLKALAKRVREADEEAYRAHLDAEETFNKAERILSTSMAREGCHKATLSWDLYERAIAKAEAGLPSTASK